MRKRFLVLSLVLISVLMACTFVACSGSTGGRCSGGHTWADHTTLVEATCTTPGSVLQQCSVCGIKREASVSALGHKLELEPGSAIDPTCTTEGYTGTQACVNNGCSYSEQGSVIPAIQHAYGVWVSVGDGTHKRVCGNDSSHVEIESCSGGTADCGTKAKCDICGGEYGEVSTEHVFDKQVVDEKYLASPATCTSKATYYFSCKCGTKGTETFESGDILPHVYDQKNTDAKYLKHAANCISGAEYYLSCACGHLDKATAGTFFDGVPTGKHVFDREVAEEKYLATPATCTSKAQYHFSCECGEEGTTTFESGNLLAHSMTHHQAVPATCVATGFVEYWTCSSCGFDYDTAQGGTVLESVVEQINPNNHVNTSVTVSEVAPTCTTEGRTANLYCDDCNKEVIASTIVDALGHTGGTATCTDKAVCDRCDQPYGDLAGHAFGNWTSNGNDTHSRVCANDASHTETAPCSGGTATPTSKAICDVCGKEYGSFAEIPTGQVTIVTNIGEYATANGWIDGTGYETVNLDAIVFATAIPTTGQYNNTGKYYSSNSTWRVYQNENPQLTIKALEGFVIVSVKITYSKDKTGVLTLDGVNVNSNEVVNVNANSVVFSVGNTKSDVTNGNIRITAIEVVYKYACAHSNTEEREQVNATCTKDGLTAGTFCKDCESYVSGGEVIEALGHDYPTTWTSDGNGKHYKECGVCGEKDEKDCEYTLETVLANNANLCAPATCTSRATFYKVCECGHFNSDDQNVFESGSALGHIDEDGNNVCDREECKLPLCNGNHIASDYVVDGEYHYQVCTACHEEINRDKHSATSLNQGNDTQHWYVCDICDAEYGHENHQEEAGECACGKLIESKVINTIAGALVAEEGAEVNLNGVVSGLYQEWSDQYNNMSFYITDGSDTILIYGAPKLVYVGDTVNVDGVISVYKNTNQVAQNSTVTITKAHDCSFSEADCINASKCTICGKLNAEALGHADENKDGKCDRCNADLNAPEPELAGTITFDDKSKRTEFSTSIQVWKENGITVTNKKTNNSSNVADYAKPARFYKSSSLSIEYTAMTKIVFKCNADEYATDFSKSITSGKYTVSVDGKNVTVIFVEAVDSFVIDSLSGQVRMDGIEVYTTPAGSSSPEAQHTFGEWHDEIPATCVATGTKGYKQCTTCQKYFDAEGVEITDLTIAVDPNAHDTVQVGAQASTCTTKGWNAYEYCKREGCNHNTKVELELAEHTPSAAVEENRTESTCTTQGSYDSVVYCSECNAEISRTKVELGLDENAHSWVAGAVTAPTCTEDGYTTYTCECGDTYKDFDENSAQGHSFTKYTGTEATCLEDGTKTSKCDRCDAVDTKVTPALGHNDSNSDKICDTCQAALCNGNHTPAEAVKENVVDATCSNEGSYYSVVYCSVCHVQISKEQKTIDKLPHTEETIPAVDASCTETGLTAGKKCSVCGVITQAQEVVSKLPHTPVTDEAVEPNCTETGLTEGSHCGVCNEVIKAQEVVPAKGHKEVDIPAVDASCTETGLTAGKECSVCREITKAQEEVPAKGHTSEVVEGKDATCTETGLTDGSKCSVCGETLAEREEIPAKGHTPVKNVCACGHELTIDEIIGLAKGLTTDGQYLNGTYVLTGVITNAKAINTNFNSIEVTIEVEGTEEKFSFLCYGMKGDDINKIGVGDTITVSGKIKNYKGTIEFDTNCVLESYTTAQYEVKFETLGGGTISGIPTSTVARGTKFTIKVTPDEANDYVIDAVTVNGVAVPGTDGNYTITVNAESTVIAYFKKAGAGSVVTNTTVSVVIKDHASANGWSNGTQHSTIELDKNVSATASGSSNTGKYYESGYEWRIYQTENPTLTISGGANVTILSVKITYNISNSGTLTYNGNITSGTVVEVNASTITFGVGNTGNKTNGQVKVTAIEVTYKSNTAAEGACTHSEEKWGAWTIAKEATCTEMGVEMATCECGEIKTRYSLPINPNAHDIVQVDAQASTCTTKGWEAYEYCKREGCNHNTKVELDLDPNNHVYDKEVATGDYLVSGATCKDLAVYNKSCACGEKGTETFTHGDYAEHTFGEWHDEIPATCVATGTKGHKQCTTCQKYFDAEGVEITDLTIAADPNAHDLEYVGAQASTCTEQGWNAYEYCKREGCGHTTKELLPLAEHVYEKEVATEDYLVSSATCKDLAVYNKSCACGAKGATTFTHGDYAEHTPSTAVEENRVESTCTEAGGYDMVVSCTVCNRQLSSTHYSLPLAEHVYDKEVATEDYLVSGATCKDLAVYNKSCACGAKGTATFTHGDYAEHTFGEWHDEIPATCVATGTKGYKQCTTCQKNFDAEGVEITGLTIAVDPNAHDIVQVGAQASTCTEKGWNAYEYCKREGCNHNTKVELGLDGNAHDWSDWVVDVAATCTATGTSHRDCQREGCNKTESRTDGMISHVDLDHNNVCDSCLGSLCEEHTPGHMESDKDGHWYVCSECGFALEKEEHTFGEWQTTTEASCTVDGAKRRDCVSCDAFETDVIKAEGHKHTSQETAPTCTDDGYTTYTCACGDAYIVVDKDSALGHKYDAVVTDPDCENGGYTTYTCSVCGDNYKANETSATGHNHVNPVYVMYNDALHTMTTCHCGDKHYEAVDTTAPVEASTEADLRTVLGSGLDLEVALTNDLTITETIEITSGEITLDLGGYTITANQVVDSVCEVFYVKYSAKLTIKNGSLVSDCVEEGDICVNVISAGYGGEINVYNTTITSAGCTAVFARSSAVINIYSGKFEAQVPYEEDGKYYTLDVREEEVGEARGTINVYGGTYVNFDPANHTNDGADYTNKVAEGYHSIADGDNYVVSAHSHSATVTAPTCTENGYTTYTCVCGDDYIVVDDDSALGHDEVAHEAKAPTCTEIGWDAYVTCSRCAHTTYQEKASLGHDMQPVDAQAPTCMAPGWNAYEYCKREGCDHNTKEELPIDEDAHSYSSSVTQPTCSTAGYTTYTCECGDTYTEPGAAATGHTDGEAVVENRIESTCTAQGSYDSVVYCSVCDEELSRETGLALELDEDAHEWNSGVQTKAPTCTAEGVMTFTCKHNSDHVDNRAIDKIAHEYVDGHCTMCYATKISTEEVVAKFTMGADGTATHSDGGSDTASYEETNNGITLSITGASKFYPSARDAKGNGCIKLGTNTAAGVFTFTVPDDVDRVIIYIAKYKANTAKVTVNGATTTLTKNSNDGAYDEIVIDTSTKKTVEVSTASGGYRAMLNTIEFIRIVEKDCDHADRGDGTKVAPTCTEKGYTHFVCPVCEEEFNWDYVDALGHDMQPVAAKDATCEEDGHSSYEQCSRCEHHTEFEVTPATGHSSQAAVQENVVNATCTEAGSYDSVVYCATCNEELSREKETIDPLGHVDNDEPKDYKCDRCTEPMCKEHVNALGEFEHDENEHWQVCDNCKERFNVSVHEFCNWTSDGNDSSHSHTCNVCGVKETKQCDYVAGEVVKPTCTAQGYTNYICSDCGDAKVDNHTDVLPHNLVYVVDGEQHYQECSNEGCTHRTEAVDHVYTYTHTDSEHTGKCVCDATVSGAHNMNGNECTVCDYVKITKQFVKVTTAPSDWSGTYLIVYEAGKLAFNGTLSSLDATGNNFEVDIIDGTIAHTPEIMSYVFNIAKSGSNYTIKSESGYYIGQTSNANGLKSSTSTTYANTITLNSDGSVNLVSGGAYLRYNAASNQNRFRYYSSSTYTNQKAITLYKLVG